MPIKLSVKQLSVNSKNSAMLSVNSGRKNGLEKNG